MPNKLVESKMTQLIELLGDMVEKGGVDELDSEPATDFAKDCWERFCKIYDAFPGESRVKRSPFHGRTLFILF